TEVPSQLLADMEAAVALCSQWDEELFDCFRDQRPGAACERAFDRLRGLADSRPARPGPDARWHLTLPAPAQAVHLLPDGSVLSAAGGQIARHRDGQQVWAADLPGGALGWLLPVEPDGVVVADREGHVALLELASGQIRWRRELPLRRLPRADDEEELKALPAELRQARLQAGGAPEQAPHPLALNATRDGEQLLLGSSDGRLLRLDLGVCAERQVGCFRAPERLFIDELGSFNTWSMAPGGRRLVGGSRELLGIERTGEELFRIRFGSVDRLGAPVASSDGTFVLVGLHALNAGRVLAIDPAACRSEEPLRMPEPASLHVGHDHESEALPPGCLAWEVELDDLAILPPADLGPGQGVLALGADEGMVLRVRQGEVLWRSRLGAVAATAGGPGLAYLLTGAPALVALDTADGEVLWQSALPYPRRPDFTEVWPSLRLRERWLLIADGPELSLFELPPAQGAGS
ncbi:MAG TPA: PQQ-binding-like beta-propeller repeat protein, partial [Myxococcota bacterium]|nr:PQQ-binding-like beta-propeller repeat protein [Myxococcota bacterium]